MHQRLYPNIKRMNTLFCVGIAGVTLVALILRLTFDDVATVHAEGNGSTITHAEPKQSGGTGSDSGFGYRINTDIQYASLNAKGNVMLENPASNDCYIRIEITRNDNGKRVYYTGDLRPDTAIGSARLTGNIDANGEYPCTATITALDPLDKTAVEQVTLPVTLYVGVRPEG